MFWFLCSQVVLAGGKYVLWRNFGCGCKGHLLFPGKRTDFAFWAKLILLAARGEGVWEVAYVIETRRVVVKLFYWQGKVFN